MRLVVSRMVSQALQGVIRSLRIYLGPDAPRDAMDNLYRRFIEPGALVFDVGRACRRAGYPHFAAARCARDRSRAATVAVLGRASSARPRPAGRDRRSRSRCDAGIRELFVQYRKSDRLNLVGKISSTRPKAREDGKIRYGTFTSPIEIVTLDGLIARYGVPDFIKIDVEGYEDAVLRGLSHPVKALSFEFTTIARDVAMSCFDRLSALADYRYNWALGESQTLTFDRWISDAEMADLLSNLPHDANSATSMRCSRHTDHDNGMGVLNAVACSLACFGFALARGASRIGACGVPRWFGRRCGKPDRTGALRRKRQRRGRIFEQERPFVPY